MTDHIGKPFDLNYLVNLLLQRSGFQPVASVDAPAPAAPSDDDLPAAPLIKNSVSIDGSVVVDLETALSHLDGLTDLYVDLAKQFIEELESVVAEYDRALSASLLPEAARQMHTLKGTAATLGVMPLSLLALDLEKLCKASTQTTDALAREPELEAMVNTSIVALRTAIEKLET
jgi:HPt (histidine-containing phosphotransfer) domain-containing protein